MEKVTKGFLNLPDAHLYYEHRGAGDTVLFVHGFGFDRRAWQGQWNYFGEHYHTIRYDRRGFGQSLPPQGEAYSESDDLRNILQYLKVQRAHFVGHSQGGSVVIDFALNYPNKVSSIVLVDAIVSGYKWNELRESMKEIWFTGAKIGIQEAKRLFLKLEIFGPALKKRNCAEQIASIINGYSGWHWCHKDTFQALEPPAIERLWEIEVPALIVAGEQDTPDFQRVSAILNERIQKGNLRILEGVGHMANMEDPDQFNSIVDKFLASII